MRVVLSFAGLVNCYGYSACMSTWVFLLMFAVFVFVTVVYFVLCLCLWVAFVVVVSPVGFGIVEDCFVERVPLAVLWFIVFSCFDLQW